MLGCVVKSSDHQIALASESCQVWHREARGVIACRTTTHGGPRWHTRTRRVIGHEHRKGHRRLSQWWIRWERSTSRDSCLRLVTSRRVCIIGKIGRFTLTRRCSCIADVSLVVFSLNLSTTRVWRYSMLQKHNIFINSKTVTRFVQKNKCLGDVYSICHRVQVV